ncbi:MAG: pyridoxal-phosphate dependent enzyme [Pseudonocardiaceae bacterium]|nr:pyridoxal-phosphate dependent enzyme [Pseudonocardiaceae bacterium]
MPPRSTRTRSRPTPASRRDVPRCAVSRRDRSSVGVLVDPDSITAAAVLLDGNAVRTPVLDASHWAGGPLGLKLENLQPTGAFKLRGATVAVARLDAATRSRGVVTHSSGNHAQALAWAARAAGVAATIVIPHGAAAGKVAATEALGARVLRADAADRGATADRVVAETGGALVPPYDHPDVIAGQGTVGLEIAETVPDVEVVLVPISGGGLISGIAAALTHRGVRVVGVEPELAADAAEGLRNGVLTAWSPEQVARTAADGLRVTQLGALPWEHVRTMVHDIVTVAEDEIADAARCLALRARVVAEPSGAVSTAAWLHHRAELPAGRTVAVVSGGNVDPGWLAAVLTHPPTPRRA